MFGRGLVRFISLLIEENSNAQLAMSCVVGMFLGLFPTYSLQWAFCFLLCMLFRFNLFTVIGAGIFSELLRTSLETILDRFGLVVLTGIPALFPLWQWMYHAPIFPYSSFNNTIDLASTVFAIAISPCVWIFFYLILRRYRQELIYYWKTTRLFRTYASYQLLNKQGQDSSF